MPFGCRDADVQQLLSALFSVACTFSDQVHESTAEYDTLADLKDYQDYQLQASKAQAEEAESEAANLRARRTHVRAHRLSSVAEDYAESDSEAHDAPAPSSRANGTAAPAATTQSAAAGAAAPEAVQRVAQAEPRRRREPVAAEQSAEQSAEQEALAGQSTRTSTSNPDWVKFDHPRDGPAREDSRARQGEASSSSGPASTGAELRDCVFFCCDRPRMVPHALFGMFSCSCHALPVLIEMSRCPTTEFMQFCGCVRSVHASLRQSSQGAGVLGQEWQQSAASYVAGKDVSKSNAQLTQYMLEVEALADSILSGYAPCCRLSCGWQLLRAALHSDFAFEAFDMTQRRTQRFQTLSAQCAVKRACSGQCRL